MLKKSITFEDLDGNSITEDFYFNLSKAELVEMELSEKNGFAASLQRIIDSSDGAEIIHQFKSIILKSVGLRSEDGRRFIKSKEISDEFSQTDAYTVLFMELATDADAAGAFVRGIVPAGMDIQVTPPVESPVAALEAPVEAPKPDLSSLSREELLHALADKEVPTQE